MDYLGQERREGLGRKPAPRVNLALLMLVSAILLLSSLYSAQASVFQKAREGALDAASPVLTLLAKPVAAINAMIGHVGDYFSVLEQNRALREENAELRQWMGEALALRRSLANYQALDRYVAPPEASPLDAFVIGETNDAFARSMVVNAGAREAVRPGYAVLDAEGVVGRVVETGAFASRILLLSDFQSRVPVYVEGAEVEGILVGAGATRPTISITERIDEDIEFTQGQRVLTSGAGGALPRGLPIGEIASLRRGEVQVALFARARRAREVRVLRYEFPAVDAQAEALTGDGENGDGTDGVADDVTVIRGSQDADSERVAISG